MKTKAVATKAAKAMIANVAAPKAAKPKLLQKRATANPSASKPTVAALAAKEAKLQAEGETVKLSIPITSAPAVIEKLIASLKLRGVKMDVDMHSAACASLNHAGLHNDPTLLNRLLLALPKATRRNAMAVWAMKHGNVMLNTDSKTKEHLPLVYDKSKKLNIDAAQAEPFWAMKNIREGGEAWLYLDYIGSVLKTLKRHAEDATSPEHQKAKAAYDALTSVNEALAVPAVAVPVPAELH